jgi:hypothetical protein
MSDNKNSHQPIKKDSLKRRTTSSIVTSSTVNAHKLSNSISSSFVCYDLQVEKIKLEIQARLKEQQKRENFLDDILKIENELSNAEMLTEANRKNEPIELKQLETESFWKSFRKLCCKCLT